MTFHKALSRTLLVGMMCFTALPVFAQEDQPPAIPPTPDAATIERGRLDLEAYQEAFESRSVYDFRIAYLIAPDALPADHIASEQMMVDMTGAQVFGDWETFDAENEAEPFQVLLIHDSMYEQVDVAVTQAAYRNRVIIFGMGMPFDHLVEVTGDRCIEEPNPAYRDEAHEMVLLFHYIPEVSDESLRENLDDIYLTTCDFGERSDLTDLMGEGLANVFRGSMNFFFSDLSYDPLYFASTIVSQTINHGIEPNQPTENQ